VFFLNILFDYFRATFKDLKTPDLIEYLGLWNLNWIEGRPRDGWTQHDYFNGIHLYSGGRDDIGIELSGVGCRTLESLNELAFDWYAFLRWVSEMGDSANVSRLDVAGDEEEGILNFSTMVRSTRAGKYISKSRTRHWTDGDERIIMFGASASSTRLRIYDKALERGIEGHWMRCEFQLRDEAADSFIANYLQYGDIGRVYGGVLLNYLRYTTKAPDPAVSHNYDSLRTVKWWSDFVGTSEKIHNVTVGGLEYNLDSLDSYISGQCASSIRAYITLNSLDRLLEVVKHTPYSAKQKQLLASLGVALDE
jgi:hypothetical protein